MIVVYKEDRDMTVSDVLLRLFVTLYNQYQSKKEKQVFLDIVLLELDDVELILFYKEVKKKFNEIFKQLYIMFLSVFNL